MRSKVASEVGRAQRQKLSRLSAEERTALAQRLGESSIRSYMAVHHVDRSTAVARIKATRRLGRRPSSSAEG